MRDYFIQPIDCVTILEFLLFIVGFRHHFFQEHNRIPNADDMAAEFNSDKKDTLVKHSALLIVDFEAILGGKSPKDIPKTFHEALRLRWGYVDHKIRKLKQASREIGISLVDLLESEIELVEKLGWRVKDTATDRKKWIKN